MYFFNLVSNRKASKETCNHTQMSSTQEFLDFLEIYNYSIYNFWVEGFIKNVPFPQVVLLYSYILSQVINDSKTSRGLT